MSRKMKRKMAEEMQEMKRKMARMEKYIMSNIAEDESSSYSSFKSDDSGEESPVVEETVAQVHAANIPDVTPLLGSNPNDLVSLGGSLNEEIVVRWTTYLTQGVTTEIRESLHKKFPIPQNCSALKPPKMNEEVKSVVPESSMVLEKFLVALQQQLATGLTALGEVINEKLDKPENDVILSAELTQKLAESAQILANVHYAISMKRRTNIVPHMNLDCKAASQQSPIDEYLFGSLFVEKVKAHKTLIKSGLEIKRNRPKEEVKQRPLKKHLNFKRTYNRGKMREVREQRDKRKTWDHSKLGTYSQSSKPSSFRQRSQRRT